MKFWLCVLLLFTGCASDKVKPIRELCHNTADGLVICPPDKVSK